MFTYLLFFTYPRGGQKYIPQVWQIQLKVQPMWSKSIARNFFENWQYGQSNHFTLSHFKGVYLAELTKELFKDLETSKYQYAEYRLSIYGRKITEWDTLASWIVDNKLFSENVRWLIQIPRLYSEFKSNSMVQNMKDIVESNILQF